MTILFNGNTAQLLLLLSCHAVKVTFYIWRFGFHKQPIYLALATYALNVFISACFTGFFVKTGLVIIRY